MNEEDRIKLLEAEISDLRERVSQLEHSNKTYWPYYVNTTRPVTFVDDEI